MPVMTMPVKTIYESDYYNLIGDTSKNQWTMRGVHGAGHVTAMLTGDDDWDAKGFEWVVTIYNPHLDLTWTREEWLADHITESMRLKKQKEQLLDGIQNALYDYLEAGVGVDELHRLVNLAAEVRVELAHSDEPETSAQMAARLGLPTTQEVEYESTGNLDVGHCQIFGHQFNAARYEAAMMAVIEYSGYGDGAKERVEQMIGAALYKAGYNEKFADYGNFAAWLASVPSSEAQQIVNRFLDGFVYPFR